MPVFEMAQYNARTMVGMLLLIQLMILWLFVLAIRVPSFTVTAEGLRIGNSLFGRTVPIGALRLGEARIFDLGTESGLALRWRRFGIGLPGYKAGWFRLRDGEKALVFLGGGRQALYIPTSDGYALLIAPDRPADCLRALKGTGG